MSHCPPRRAALLAALTLFSSPVFGQSYMEEPVNQKLEQLAVSLAASLQDPSVRQLVKNEVGEKFDGAHNALYSSMANQPLSGERTFRQELVRSISAFSGDTRSAARNLDHLALEFPRLQIAVPAADYEKWDALKTVPLVTYIPQGVDVDSLAELKAFDGNGKLHLLSTSEAPGFPVVILGMNERTNEFGFLEKISVNSKSAADSKNFENDSTRLIEPPDDGGDGGGGGGGSWCIAKTHNRGDREWLRYITIYNDHEVWYDDPDIYLNVAYLEQDDDGNQILVERTVDLIEVDNEGHLYYRADFLLDWKSTTSSNILFTVREADGGSWTTRRVTIDGPTEYDLFDFKTADAILGWTYVNFNDSNCKVHTTNNGEAQLIFDYTPAIAF